LVTSQWHTLVVPDYKLLKLLGGTVIQFRNVLSEKPATKGQHVDLYIATKGSGMLGLVDYKDSFEWAGINNNVWRTARVATYLAQLLNEAGVPVDVQLVLDAMLVFKLGRRRWDESIWYPTVVPNAEALQKKGDTNISLELLEEAGVSDSIRKIVNFRKLGLEYPADLMDSWENKVCMYADFRTSQSVTSLQERFEDLSRRRRASQEELDYLSAWAFKAEQEIFSKLTILPKDITNDSPVMPYWEAILRYAYLEDAQVSAYSRLTHLYLLFWKRVLTEAEFTVILDKEFPSTSWWGIGMQRGYEEGNGIPIQAKTPITGLLRAISVFETLRQS
jgi:hypothetical protein